MTNKCKVRVSCSICFDKFLFRLSFRSTVWLTVRKGKLYWIRWLFPWSHGTRLAVNKRKFNFPISLHKKCFTTIEQWKSIRSSPLAQLYGRTGCACLHESNHIFDLKWKNMNNIVDKMSESWSGRQNVLLSHVCTQWRLTTMGDNYRSFSCTHVQCDCILLQHTTQHIKKVEGEKMKRKRKTKQTPFMTRVDCQLSIRRRRVHENKKQNTHSMIFLWGVDNRVSNSHTTFVSLNRPRMNGNVLHEVKNMDTLKQHMMQVRAVIYIRTTDTHTCPCPLLTRNQNTFQGNKN